MATTVEYALMAGRAYQTNRDPQNQFSIPRGWTEFFHVPDPAIPSFPTTGGFEAVAFKNSSNPNDIVISYAGTDGFLTVDQFANLGLATGFGSGQLNQAADYYLAVQAANPTANITFTGHSLGGGLAALMGVFFGRQATTFDQAPFKNSAELSLLHPDVATNLKQYLLDKTLTDPIQAAARDALVSGLGNFLALRQANGGIPNSSLVSTFRVDGEFLGALPFTPIGASAATLTHGDYFGPFDLHSQALLTAFLQSDAFRLMTSRLPELLGMVFDTNLFAYTTDKSNTTDPNLLEHLIRHQAGVSGSFIADAMLDRYTADLDKLVQAQGGTQGYRDLVKALVAFAMEKYYGETTASAKYQQELFLAVTGGLQFDTQDIAANITSAKGYSQYFVKYLETDPLFTFAERNLIKQKIVDLRDWSIAVGTSGMTAADSNNRGAFMLGGDGNDTFTGGTAGDLLVGGAGSDTLTGGAGADNLIGGAGNDILDGRDGAGGDMLDGGTGYDTYYADNGDTIRDAGGQGKVILNGKTLTFATRNKGETVWHDAAGNTYIYNNGSLQINDPLTIEGFDNGELGIYLDEAEYPPKPKPPVYNSNDAIRRWDPFVLDLDGNGQIDAVGSSASSVYFDFNGDGIAEKAGWIAPQDGLLALDANANNVVDNLGELFGSNIQDGFAELRGHDSNADGKIDIQDADFAKLRVWQDVNQDGISQGGELRTLDELSITSINLATTPANTPIADNLLTATGSFTRNGTTQLAADILLAVNFALTDSNPNRPLDLSPQLDGEVFTLPWLRGYGNVKSLPVAYQEDPALRQAARDLIAQGRNGILQNFDGFMAKWTGLSAAHAAHGVTRTNLTVEDKIWMLENLTGQDLGAWRIAA
ncbi:MAG: hypothetical protein HY066_09540 [Betaproteobacteria bacterium]|nr:hypothetical protein [Betaproteobacteria bacterium]